MYIIWRSFLVKMLGVKCSELSIYASIYLSICNIGSYFALIELQY